MKKKGKGVEILGPYLHFYSGVSKEKRAKQGVSILVTKRYESYIVTWEAINEKYDKVIYEFIWKEVMHFRNLCNKW
jgi:hypothetical protein